MTPRSKAAPSSWLPRSKQSFSPRLKRLAPALIPLLSLVLGLWLSACGGQADVRPRPLKPGVTFNGVWDSNWGEMRLTQKGKRVFGTFKYRNGSLAGTLDGDVLHFRWKQTESRYAGSGAGYLQLSPDGQHMEGRWGYNDNEIEGGRWWADRAESSAETESSNSGGDGN
jgi:hypothetical protein